MSELLQLSSLQNKLYQVKYEPISAVVDTLNNGTWWEPCSPRKETDVSKRFNRSSKKPNLYNVHDLFRIKLYN